MTARHHSGGGSNHSNSLGRENLAGGGGAFSNFFEELADDLPGDEDGGGADVVLERVRPLSAHNFPQRQHHSSGGFFGLPEDDEDDDLAILSNFSALRGQQAILRPGSGGEGGAGQLLRQSLSSNHEVCVFYKRKQPKILQGRYMLGDTIGKGSYGKVKDCLDLTTLQRCAVKIVSKMMIRKIPGGMRHVEQEIELMRGLEHPNIVTLLADFVEGERERRCMVLEYCLGSIHDLQAKGIQDSQQFRCLPLAQAHGYFIQVIEGVDFLHSRRIIHKDLKPGNMLLTEHEVVKIIDFGVSEQLGIFDQNDKVSGGNATPAIQPPEVALGVDRVSGFKLDVYSCGVSLYFMLIGEVPFNHPNMLQIFEQIAEGRYTIPDWIEPNAADLIRAMLFHDPEERYTLAEVRKHVWFKTVYPPGEKRISLMQHLFPRARTNPLTVIDRLKVYYDWPGLSSGDEDEDEVIGQDVTSELHDSLHRLGISGPDDVEFYPDYIEDDDNPDNDGNNVSPRRMVIGAGFADIGSPRDHHHNYFRSASQQDIPPRTTAGSAFSVSDTLQLASSLPRQRADLRTSATPPTATTTTKATPSSGSSVSSRSRKANAPRVKLKKPNFCKQS